MVNPIRRAGLPADSITPKSKTHVFMLTLCGGEKLGFDRAKVFLVSFHRVLNDTFISRLWSATFQPALIFWGKGAAVLPTALRNWRLLKPSSLEPLAFSVPNGRRIL